MYLCVAYEDNGRRKFHEPIELYENWNVTHTNADFMNIGLELFNYARIRTSSDHADYYHIGDRVYLFVEPPTEHDEFCTTADYQVYKDPITTLNECTVWLQKLSGRNGNNKIY